MTRPKPSTMRMRTSMRCFSRERVDAPARLVSDFPEEEAAELAALQLTDVRTKMADLTRIEAVLSRLVNECHAQRGTVSCPLIDSLHGS